MAGDDDKLPFAKNFRELLVYQKAYKASLEVHGISIDINIPKYEQYGGICDQMRRASKGICANIAEGHGKTAYPSEWRRFLLMALGSAQEMLVWTDYAGDLGYIQPVQAKDLSLRYIEISKMLRGLIKS